MTPFGNHLRKLRANKNVTQKQMAAAIGVSAAYLSALEHGKRGTPSYALVQRIVGYLNIIWDEAEALQKSAELSNPRVVVNTVYTSAKATEVANVMSKRIGALDDKTLEQLLNKIR